MEKYYFVFTRGQPLEQMYIVVEAVDELEAIKKKQSLYKDCPAFIYSEKEWNQYGEPLSKYYSYQELK